MLNLRSHKVEEETKLNENITNVEIENHFFKWYLISDLTETTGKLFSNMEEMTIDEVAKDRILAKKLFLIDEYWTGLKSKEEIKTS